MSQYKQALSLAALGFYVFPLAEHGKLPAIDGWERKATRDADMIEKWWHDSVLEIELPRNIGIFTGKFGDDQALLVVDVDNKNGKSGDDELLKLEMDGDEFPPTWESLTPTGGRHLIYLVDKPVKQGANVLGDGLDIRSHGGYIVAPGSIINIGEYKWQSPASLLNTP